MNKGYMGRVLWVDLSSGHFREEKIPDHVYAQFLSGMGLAAYLLYNRMPAGADPLGPDNILGFVSGLLTGTGSLFTGRWMVVGKSPLTGGWGDSNCGGNLSPAIKHCGYDGIFFKGVSAKPVYLLIDKGHVALKDASPVWGLDTIATEEALKKSSGGRRFRVACIGPGGEKKSLIAGIANDGGRMAARSGLGAVMGAKNLKAVVLGGAQRIQCHNFKAVKALSQKCNDAVQFMLPFPPSPILAYFGTVLRALPAQPNTDILLFNTVLNLMLKKWGTASLNQLLIELGDSPIKNWKGSNEDFGRDRSERLSPEAFSDCVIVKYHCYSCPLGCGGICTKAGHLQETHKPEYETVLALGGLCLNDDPESIFIVNDMLNRAGMDTISVGGTVAFAIECYEQGLLTPQDVDGLDLTWGNSRAIIALVEKMIRREGIGDILADGVKVASQKIGKGSEAFAIHAGGQELAMHDGRFDPGFALHNCVEPTPGRHTIGSQLYYELYRLWDQIENLPEPDLLYLKRSKFEPDKEKATAAAACSQFVNVMNGAGGCLYAALLGPKRFPLFQWLNAATGWNHTPEDYMQIGARIQTLRQAFNVKHGIEPKDIKMTDRALGRPPLDAGANKGRSISIERMMRDYWEAFGWEPETGKPRPEALYQMGFKAPSNAR